MIVTLLKLTAIKQALLAYRAAAIPTSIRAMLHMTMDQQTPTAISHPTSMIQTLALFASLSQTPLE
jgi:hypothetical protein